MARALSLTADVLASIDPRNDGQILASDAIIPGSTVLGYANADHWAVAIAIEDQFSLFAGRPGVTEPFPADVLFEAMVLFVGEALQDP
jgi:hypothetical protein